MSNDIATGLLVGRLTRDAELKYTQGGTAVVNASIACGYRRKTGDTWNDGTSFFDFSYFGKGAEAVHKYLTNGKQIAVKGDLRQERWEKDGQKNSKIKIIADHVQLLGDKSTSAPAPATEQDDDVPF